MWFICILDIIELLVYYMTTWYIGIFFITYSFSEWGEQNVFKKMIEYISLDKFSLIDFILFQNKM